MKLDWRNLRLFGFFGGFRKNKLLLRMLVVFQEGRMEKTLETVRSNFNSIRTGRASPAMLDKIEV